MSTPLDKPSFHPTCKSTIQKLENIMEKKFVERINSQLPRGMELVDCTKKPLFGTLWGRRNTKSCWKITSKRKEYWFRSISSIHRWMDAQGYSDYHQGKPVSLKDDDVLVYTMPKRLCFYREAGVFYCIIPAQNTWSYRKKGKCKRCEEILKYSFVEGQDYLYHNGQLVLDLGSDQNIATIQLIVGVYHWKAEEVSKETLLNYQKNNYPE